jgi:hypothetical protein
MGYLSGPDVYKKDLFVPFIKIRKMDGRSNSDLALRQEAY